jgi:hypothetical protein
MHEPKNESNIYGFYKVINPSKEGFLFFSRTIAVGLKITEASSMINVKNSSQQ